MGRDSRPAGEGEQPLVSIIIPCYNYGRYLGEAIESALGQTYQLLEVIVIDDGSTDDTPQVARRYPVQLIRQPNQGLARAFNRGIAAAQGEYCLHLDADDKLHPSYLERTVPVLKGHPEVAFVYTHVAKFGAEEELLVSRHYGVRALKRGNYIISTALTRREALERVGGFDPHLAWGQDWDLWLSFAERGLYGALVPEPLLYYRRHPAGSMGAVGPLREVALTYRVLRKHRLLYRPPEFFLVMLYAVVIGLLKAALAPLKRLSPPAYEAVRRAYYRVLGSRGIVHIPYPAPGRKGRFPS